MGAYTCEDKSFEKELNTWVTFYRAFKDDSEHNADLALYHNFISGQLEQSTESLRSANFQWVQDLKRAGLSEQEIISGVPEAKEYCEEAFHMTHDIDKKVIQFCDLIPGPVGQELDAHFKNKNWELQSWDTGSSSGYQVFFGEGVQVDNLFEYGFPYLYEKDELLTFAQDFYEKHLSGSKIPLLDQIQSAAARTVDTKSSSAEKFKEPEL